MGEKLGFVLAGGHSRRMGRDKALLPWGDGTLLTHAVSRLGDAGAAPHVLSGGSARYAEAGVPVLPDVVADAGALGGVLTGLERLRGGAGLFLAVDLPFVPVPLLRRLLELCAAFDAVVPVSPSGPEPLCAAYGPGCLEPVRRSVSAGRFKMTAFWPDVRVRELPPAELEAFGDPDRLFANLNEPAAYRRLRPGSL